MTKPLIPNENNIRLKSRKKVLNAKKWQIQDFLYLDFIEEMMIVSIFAIKNQLLVTCLIYPSSLAFQPRGTELTMANLLFGELLIFYSAYCVFKLKRRLCSRKIHVGISILFL